MLHQKSISHGTDYRVAKALSNYVPSDELRFTGLVGRALKSGAEYIRTQLQKIDPDNIEQIERAGTLLNYYRLV